MKIHIVQKGDTLWKIAKKYGVNFEELKQMNTQLSNPDMIMPGMKIKVPAAGGSVKKEAPISGGGGKGTKINVGSKKEMPIVDHPFAKEKPVPLPEQESPEVISEVPKPKVEPKAPVKEIKPKAPVAVPKTEKPYVMPKAELPMKHIPKPAPKLPKAEAPKTLPKIEEKAAVQQENPMKPYVPKMPAPVIPETDIQNYYMQNMANLGVQPNEQPLPKLPPKPDNIFPPFKQQAHNAQLQPTVEPESSSMVPTSQGGFQQSMIPYPYNYCPVSTGVQGVGYSPQGGMQGYPYQPNYGMPAAYPAPQAEMESSSYISMPNMPHMGSVGGANMPNMPHMGSVGGANMPNMPHMGSVGGANMPNMPHMGSVGGANMPNMPHMGSVGGANMPNMPHMGSVGGANMPNMPHMGSVGGANMPNMPHMGSVGGANMPNMPHMGSVGGANMPNMPHMVHDGSQVAPLMTMPDCDHQGTPITPVLPGTGLYEPEGFPPHAGMHGGMSPYMHHGYMPAVSPYGSPMMHQPNDCGCGGGSMMPTPYHGYGMTQVQGAYDPYMGNVMMPDNAPPIMSRAEDDESDEY
ncbi:SafA/ExsA family spore coat assembly protein [Bacillus massilinigeriensis]|uniref:SafA/ExsA family spore coat assembly protein n=1 Tax=Bacillus mediterraneensis TaxID=1805474 RepID=UPI0008F925BD|nr:SafA/ExsA family spore coat assembly protein [Bacillus mediterraneensis]